MKIKKLTKSLYIFSFVFLISTQIASARPFIGSEDQTIDENCGSGCICTYTISTNYVFWIKVGTTSELTSVDCTGAL